MNDSIIRLILSEMFTKALYLVVGPVETNPTEKPHTSLCRETQELFFLCIISLLRAFLENHNFEISFSSSSKLDRF